MTNQNKPHRADSAETAVHIENLSVYYGRTPALEDICLDIKDKEYLGIIGPNGGGKTTLLKTILGLISPAQGTVNVYGKHPGVGGEAIGYVPQHSGLDKRFPISVSDAVLTGRIRRGIVPFFRYSAVDRSIAAKRLDEVGIAGLAQRSIGELSGGEFQRMLIARALAVSPRLLLLDEPTANVDARSRKQIYDLLTHLNETMTIILVTHDLMAVSSQVRRLACLNGHLTYHGEPELNEHIVNGLYGCPVDLIAHGVPHRVLKEHAEDE